MWILHCDRCNSEIEGAPKLRSFGDAETMDRSMRHDPPPPVSAAVFSAMVINAEEGRPSPAIDGKNIMHACRSCLKKALTK